MSCAHSRTATAPEAPVCVRCSHQIKMGHAYELGDHKWHTHCFSCYKCAKPLSCDSDFLVLGTDQLICSDCSHSCTSCGKKIDEKAIILASSEEAYCSDCFQCCKCGEKINDLRYAKTKKGLYCIRCHSKLLARKKYHEEKKRRQKKRLPGVPSPSVTSATSGASLPSENSESRKSFDSGTMSPNAGSYQSDLDPGVANVAEVGGLQAAASVPERSRSRPTTAELLQIERQQGTAPQRMITAPIDFSKRKTTPDKKRDNSVVSSSTSVIAQFLDDEYHNMDNTSISTSISEQRQHSSSQLDKMLQNTLDNAEEDTLHIGSDIDMQKILQANEKDIMATMAKHPQTVTRAELEQHLSCSSNDSINKTPLRGLKNKSPTVEELHRAKSPESHRPAVDLDNRVHEHTRSEDHGRLTGSISTPRTRKYSTDEDAVLQTPISDLESRPAGLGISTPKSLQKFKLSSSLAILSPRAEVVRHQNDPTVGGVPYESQGETATPAPVADISSTPFQQTPEHHRTTSSGGSKNITRSLSVRSKTFISNLRNKTKTGNYNSPGRDQSDKDFDTHSGWGVSSVHPIEESLPSQGNRRRVSGRGQSDSTIYSHALEDPDQQSHNRSQSSSNKVAMFRTPPLGAVATHSHNKSLSIDASGHPKFYEEKTVQEAEEYTSAEKDFFQKDVNAISLQLRKLKMEVKELQMTKAQVTADVEKLKSTKESLLTEIDSLKRERDVSRPITTSEESLPEDRPIQESFKNETVESPNKHQTPYGSSNGPGKTRFWKLFGGNTHSSVKTPNSSIGSKPFEISAPVLQNPNDFDDLKLLPLPNSSSNDSVLRNNSSSSSMADGHNLYGSTLVARCIYERRDVPFILASCISYIESDPEIMKTEGIYRKAGSQITIEQFEKLFASEEKVDFTKVDADVHVVTSVLKRYLRKLPNPLFTYQCYESLVNLVRDNNLLKELPLSSITKHPSLYFNILDKLSSVLRNLPIQHMVTLKLLCSHLTLLMKYQDDNLMNLHNLALVFAPGLIKDYSGEKDIVDMKERNYLVGFILQNYKDVFRALQVKIDLKIDV